MMSNEHLIVEGRATRPLTGEDFSHQPTEHCSCWPVTVDIPLTAYGAEIARVGVMVHRDWNWQR